MQLAAPQRAHPPPVPPRPSRQVVAEALKNSPRPPCPTRQAPPPPNQRPWRLEEQQRSRENIGGGRTIVYDSAHLPRPVSGLVSRSPPEDEHQLRNSNERRRPAPRDLSKLPQVVSRKSNGTIDHRRESVGDEIPRSKEESNESSKKYKSDGSEIVERDLVDEPNGEDEQDGMRVELKESTGTENNAERKRKKPQNVSFKEEEAEEREEEIKERTVEPTLVDGKDKSAPEVCATVVVIEETEGARVASQEDHDNIQRQDWLEAGVRYSSTKITLPAEEMVSIVNGYGKQDQEQEQQQQQQQQQQQHQQLQRHIDGQDDVKEEEESELVEGEVENQLEFGDLDFSSIIERIAMSSLQGLPPLPRSLSGFNLNGAGLVGEPPPPPPARSTSRPQRTPKTPTSTTSLSSQGSRPSPQGRQLTTLDTQLAILRREMFGLRQLDLSLLSQLWSLNESIQEFRQLLQEQEDRAPSPSPSSEEGDDTSYGGSSQPPPPPRRPAPTTPHHNQHQHHHHHHQHQHHKSTRSLRNSTLSPSDESPSSEEYGAI